MSFWDGTRWVTEVTPVRSPKRTPWRDWAATAAMVLVVAAFALPFVSLSAAVLPGNALTTQWSRSYAVATYQESNARISYRGTWVRRANSRYLGGLVRSSSLRGSKATIRFTGTGVSWIGPMGPTRGKANVYLNGRLVKTVNTYASRFKPAQVLFKATFSTMDTRTLALVVLGTRYHPTVAVDAFVVRGKERGTPTTAVAPALVVTPTPTAPAGAPAGIAVPASVDATGATNASPALKAFVATVPDGSTIVFKAGGVYRMDRGLEFASRHNLTFEGNGATLRSNGDGQSGSSLFVLDRDTGITIRNFNLVGNSTTPGVFNAANQHAHGVYILNSDNTEISGVTISAVWGDCVYVGSWSDTVRFHDSTCKSSGRMGVAITAGKNVTVQHAAFNTIAYGVFDIEPNTSTEGASNVKFLDNTIGTVGQPRGKRFLFGANGAAGSTISGVTVSGNTITGAGLDAYVNISTRRANIVFTNNTSTVAEYGPVLSFAHIDGLTVFGNTQPLTSGTLASITDCTGVNYR
jgi:hypothetical protein